MHLMDRPLRAALAGEFRGDGGASAPSNSQIRPAPRRLRFEPPASGTRRYDGLRLAPTEPSRRERQWAAAQIATGPDLERPEFSEGRQPRVATARARRPLQRLRMGLRPGIPEQDNHASWLLLAGTDSRRMERNAS